MLKHPLIVGSKGAMGRRYAAILKHLAIPFTGIDIGDKIPDKFDSIILATPTETHISLSLYCAETRKPILCEKPISKDIDKVHALCDTLEAYPFRMVNQYEYLNDLGDGITMYDYYNHGRDSLPWDCINIIGAANGQVELAEQSPIWICAINGMVLKLGEMDHAYIRMMSDWLDGNVRNISYVRHAHDKVQEYLDCRNLC